MFLFDILHVMVIWKTRTVHCHSINYGSHGCSVSIQMLTSFVLIAWSLDSSFLAEPFYELPAFWSATIILQCRALLNMNLSGQIAPEVGQLSRLEVLWVVVLLKENETDLFPIFIHLYWQALFNQTLFKFVHCKFILLVSVLLINFFFFERDFMWNNISGNIPKEIGKLTSLKLL